MEPSLLATVALPAPEDDEDEEEEDPLEDEDAEDDEDFERCRVAAALVLIDGAAVS